MAELRAYREGDLDALYHVCLVTGDSGRDASALHRDGKLIGHIYAAPYAALEPHNVFVVEDDAGVAGYVVGTHDTNGFAERLERDWWPALRQHYAGLAADALTSADQARVDVIVKPHVTPADIVAQYPAHIHMNLLPRLRGQKLGWGLLQLWVEQAREAGVTGIHLGASPTNATGIAFWTRSGFTHLRTEGAAWFGMTL